MNNCYLFQDKKELTQFISNQLTDPTMMKVSRSLYFCWSYYSATYGQLTDYPDYLFKAQFVALKYGPTEKSILDIIQKKETIKNSSKTMEELIHEKSEYSRNITLFLKNILSQIDQLDDFQLIFRSQEDHTWRSSYQKGVENEIDNQDIISEYVQKINKSY